MLKYENQVGSKENRNQHNKHNLCTSCTHHKTFLTLPSFKTVKRCKIYGTLSERCQFKTCKYYNSKPKFELIIGA